MKNPKSSIHGDEEEVERACVSNIDGSRSEPRLVKEEALVLQKWQSE